jgi:hypothetical protein
MRHLGRQSTLYLKPILLICYASVSYVSSGFLKSNGEPLLTMLESEIGLYLLYRAFALLT